MRAQPGDARLFLKKKRCAWTSSVRTVV